MASTAYKRARSLGWDEGFSNIIAFGILIHLSVGAWPDSVFESGSIFIITIPLYILQLYMIFKNAKPVKSIKILDNINDIGFIKFSNKDVVRNPLVSKIVNNYEKFEKAEGVGKEYLFKSVKRND